jgi:hypothetical protein
MAQPLTDRLLAKLPSIKSADNLQQVLKTVVEEIPDEDLELIYSEANDVIAYSLKANGSIKQLEAVTPLLNLLKVPALVDKLSISLTLSLDYNIYLAKIKWANQHSLVL